MAGPPLRHAPDGRGGAPRARARAPVASAAADDARALLGRRPRAAPARLLRLLLLLRRIGRGEAGVVVRERCGEG